MTAPSGAVKFSTLICDVRPTHWPRASFFPSTITSTISPKMPSVALLRNFPLLLVERSQTPRLLRIRDRIVQPQRRSIRSRRILERKGAVVAYFIKQRKCLLEFLSVSPGKPTIKSVVIEMSRFAA